jgi:hypothetical protein
MADEEQNAGVEAEKNSFPHHRKDVEEARRDQEKAAVGGYAAGETGISESASGPAAASSSSDLESDIEEGGDWSPTSARRPAPSARDKEWSAVLGRLGGSSPGSRENLALADKFAYVQFPAARDTVLGGLHPVDEFQLREGISVDLRHAVASSRKESFRNMNELIDCVKEELRRADRHVVK